MITETTIKVAEASDPLRRFQFTSVASDGTRTPYDFTGVDGIEFIGKAGRDASSVQLFYYTLADGQIMVLGDPTAGVLAVQFVAADIDTPGTFRHRMDVIKAGRTTPIMAGPLVIEDL